MSAYFCRFPAPCHIFKLRCVYLLNPEEILPSQTSVQHPQQEQQPNQSSHDHTHIHGHGYSPHQHRRQISITESPRARIPRSAARTSTSSPRSRSVSPLNINPSLEGRGRRGMALDIDGPVMNPDVELHPSHPDFHDVPDSGPGGNRRSDQARKNEYHLPEAQIETIRSLSRLVNVLPVLSRTDTLTLSQLKGCKDAVRKDLMNVGIGFGIFDVDQARRGEGEEKYEISYSAGERESNVPQSATVSATSMNSSGLSISPAVTITTGITTPCSASFSPAPKAILVSTKPLTATNVDLHQISPVVVRSHFVQSLSIKKHVKIPPLPHAIISPDMFPSLPSLSNLIYSIDNMTDNKMDIDRGVDYAAGASGADKVVARRGAMKDSDRGLFLRSFRWGSLNVFDEEHCDFVPLVKAIFFHMEVS